MLALSYGCPFYWLTIFAILLYLYYLLCMLQHCNALTAAVSIVYAVIRVTGRCVVVFSSRKKTFKHGVKEVNASH
jgi:hypothetical protein